MRSSGHLPLAQVQFKHFKAIRETGPLAFGPLTVFIGNNGSGKSSIIEALETVQRLSGEDLDAALKPFGGYEHAHYKGEVKARPRAQGERLLGQAPLHLAFRGHTGREAYSAQLTLEERENNEVFFSKEKVTRGAMTWERDAQGRITAKQKGKAVVRLANESPQDSLVGSRVISDFRQAGRTYNEHVDAAPILMHASLSKLRKSESFQRLEDKLRQLAQPVAPRRR